VVHSLAATFMRIPKNRTENSRYISSLKVYFVYYKKFYLSPINTPTALDSLVAKMPPAKPIETFVPQNTPTDSSTLSTHLWDQMPPAAGAAPEPTSLNFATAADIYKSATVADSSPAASPATITPLLDKASGINFTTPAQDGKSGTQPNFFMTADGQLHKNPEAKPDPSGKITIELQMKNKDEVNAKKTATQLQKATVKDLINFFKASHPPGTKLPQDWLDQLNQEPDLPPAPAPLGTPDSTPSTPDAAPSSPADQPTQQTPPQDNTQPQQQAINGSDTSAGGGDSGAGGGGSGGGGDSGAGGGGGGYGGGYGGGGFGGGGSGGGGGGDGGGSGSGSGGVQDASFTSSDAPASIPNLPNVANGDISAAMGNQQLNNSQQQFVEELAKKTGMDANVIGAWVYNEENGGAAASRESANNNNWLNIGYTDSGEQGTSGSLWHSGPVAAADATAAWLKGDLSVPGFGHCAPGITAILQSAGKPPGEQIAALQNSPWASSHYPDMPNIYQQIVSHDVAHPSTPELVSNPTSTPSVSSHQTSKPSIA
jgi:hypothetical protein